MPMLHYNRSRRHKERFQSSENDTQASFTQLAEKFIEHDRPVLSRERQSSTVSAVSIESAETLLRYDRPASGITDLVHMDPSISSLAQQFQSASDGRPFSRDLRTMTLGGDPQYFHPPTRRFNEDVADRNLDFEYLKDIGDVNEPPMVLTRTPTAILINTGEKRFSEDVADRNMAKGNFNLRSRKGSNDLGSQYFAEPEVSPGQKDYTVEPKHASGSQHLSAGSRHHSAGSQNHSGGSQNHSGGSQNLSARSQNLSNGSQNLSSGSQQPSPRTRTLSSGSLSTVLHKPVMFEPVFEKGSPSCKRSYSVGSVEQGVRPNMFGKRRSSCLAHYPSDELRVSSKNGESLGQVKENRSNVSSSVTSSFGSHLSVPSGNFLSVPSITGPDDLPPVTEVENMTESPDYASRRDMSPEDEARTIKCSTESDDQDFPPAGESKGEPKPQSCFRPVIKELEAVTRRQPSMPCRVRISKSSVAEPVLTTSSLLVEFDNQLRTAGGGACKAETASEILETPGMTWLESVKCYLCIMA